jgi:hypothetical protein
VLLAWLYRRAANFNKTDACVDPPVLPLESWKLAKPMLSRSRAPMGTALRDSPRLSSLLRARARASRDSPLDSMAFALPLCQSRLIGAFFIYSEWLNDRVRSGATNSARAPNEFQLRRISGYAASLLRERKIRIAFLARSRGSRPSSSSSSSSSI